MHLETVLDNLINEGVDYAPNSSSDQSHNVEGNGQLATSGW